MNKINITIEMFFEIRNAEMYGGEGSVGYAEIKEDICLESLKDYDLQEDAKGKIKGFADMMKVSREDVRIISRTEYEENKVQLINVNSEMKKF